MDIVRTEINCVDSVLTACVWYVFCVCPVRVLCVYGMCTVCVLCVYCVCPVCVLCANPYAYAYACVHSCKSQCVLCASCVLSTGAHRNPKESEAIFFGLFFGTSSGATPP